VNKFIAATCVLAIWVPIIWVTTGIPNLLISSLVSYPSAMLAGYTARLAYDNVK
jgi:hypothetical protein